MNNNTAVLHKEDLLNHWQGHRALVRRVIEKFSEHALLNFTTGNMRSFAEMVQEMLAVAVPGLDAIANNKALLFDQGEKFTSKAEVLKAWDEATPIISELFMQIPAERFSEKYNLFGQYDYPIIDNILYFIDNEVHHRAQGYVYLRALGIEPPFFWERD